MYNFEHNPPEQDERSIVTLFFLYVVFVFAGAFVGGMVGSSLFLIVFDQGIENATPILENIYNYPQYRVIYTLMQGVVSIFMFIIGPWLFIKLIAKKNLSSLHRKTSKFSILGIGLVLITILASMPFMSYLYSINRELNFGDWAREMSESLEKASNYITDFKSIPQLLVGILVMAIVPAIGEELTFRGILQNLIFKGSKNIDLSVWLAAIIFSAIHMQFDGFFVRLLLAVSFGYIYYWTGSLWYPIIGHFLNNTLTLVTIYLANNGVIQGDPETFGSMGLIIGLISLASTVGLHYLIFKNRNKFHQTSLP